MRKDNFGTERQKVLIRDHLLQFRLSSYSIADRNSASGTVSRSDPSLVEVTVHTAPDDNTSKGQTVVATELDEGGEAEVSRAAPPAQAEASEPHPQPDGEHPAHDLQRQVCDA